jgi:hypothetical protein
MRVFDVPKGYAGIGRQLRVAVHGSCRVHDPFEALAAAGKLMKVWANHLAVSYTFGEACQALQWNLGERAIPAELLPFIVDDPTRLPAIEPQQRRVLESVDVFIVEISELRQIRYRDFFFQIQVFMRNFVSRHGAALLPWYRLFSTGRPATKDVIQEALGRLAHLDAEERAFVESILVETQLAAIDPESAKRAIATLAATCDARWLFVSHFVVPGMSGTLMLDRAKLQEILRAATAACNVDFFDPSQMVGRYGRATALANAGADIYHYNPDFQSMIGDALLLQLSATLEPDRAALELAAPNAAPPLQPISCALNALLTMCHRERLARLGVDGSGLHAHYALLLERCEIVGRQELDIAEIILRYLPAFDCYHVLRAGLGEMAFLLAVLGRRTKAFDPFAGRLQALTAGAKYLRSCGFLGEDGVDATLATVPSPSPGERTLAVATQLALTASPAEEESILKQLERYDAVLFLPGALVRPRDSKADEELLIDRFRRAGFVEVRDYPHLRLVYCARNRESIRVSDVKRESGNVFARAAVAP